MFGAVAKLTLFFVTTLFAAWNHLNGDSKAGEHSLCDISISGKVDTPPAKWLGYLTADRLTFAVCQCRRRTNRLVETLL